ncbi:MAG: hypothetical protein IKR18_04250 [Bacteroidaceae bacterium]|nr:hypothetical protein [Bacteroidaceae bacterium]
MKQIMKIFKWLFISTIIAPLALLLFGDISQYKQVGDTHFYLLPNEMGEESFLYHDGVEKGMFYPINHNGSVHDVYWNQQYIIIKCSEQKKENWYIIRNIKDYNYPEFGIKHILNENDYQNVLDSLGISEINMEHTDGSIPWSLHLCR